MTANELRIVIRDLMRAAEKNVKTDDLPICAFSLRNGQIYTGRWEVLSGGGIIVVTLVNKEAPPIYISTIAIEAIAVDGQTVP